MDSNYLIDEIKYWDSEIISNGKVNIKVYELALFKIFVKFELFLTDLFINYSIGKGSSSGYIPERKLAFKDEKHLEDVIRNSKSSFIDYPEKILNISDCIFVDGRNPFSLIFMDARLNSYYIQMKLIRNYIAHESKESRKKYHKQVLGETSDFLEPHQYLAKINKKLGKTQYSIFIDAIKEMIDILLDPISFWGSDEIIDAPKYAAAAKQE